MCTRTVFLIGALLLALIATACGGPQSAHASTPSAEPPPYMPTQAPPTGSEEGPSVLPTVPPTPIDATFSAVTTPVPTSAVTGGSAIRPTRSSLDPATPAFTLQDVVDYVNAHPLDQTVGSPAPTIESIEFVPNRDVNARFTTATGRPDDALMCLVKLRGSFIVSGPAGFVSPTLDVAYMVFDAHTGNDLLYVVGGP